ncbi:MAG TPA: protein kinase [Terriglobales bacterium]|nr:protein kinase [Terriglobales bacterium]
MIGQTVSHYRITGRLGAGGMGVVYRAEDQNLQRSVALKFLPAEFAGDPQARKRLVKEAQAASRLSHPDIATIYEVGEANGTPFIAMELVSGQSLKDVLALGPLPPAQLLEVAREIAEGLHEAHQAGVLHRDIKPGNIMLDTKGRVKILDFGLAAMTGQERVLGETEENFITRTAGQGTTGGTVPYMSPEQLRGDPVDARSDIFSLGVMLYECLTGRLPFTGETSIDILHAILRQAPKPLRTLLPDVSPEWEHLVGRCLAKSPEQRPQSMGEIVQALSHMTSPFPQEEKSLAVLYFENLSASQEDEYFRDGITEDIIIELSKIAGMRVFPRSAVMAYRDKPTTVPQIGRELNAAYVLAGSLRRAGNRLRLTAQLLEARTGHSVWAERYDRQMEDVFAIQDEIAHNIAKALELMLTEKEKRTLVKAPTTDVQAYDLYLRGRQYFKQWNRKGLEFARQMFARAAVIDPGYARAYAGVADVCSVIYQYYDASEANLKEADAASRKALELDPELAEAHVARGMAIALRKQYSEAVKEFEAAIRLNPRMFEAHYFYGRARFSEGNLEEAARLFEKASQINPDNYEAPSLLGTTYSGLGRKADAVAAERRSLEIIERHLQLNPDDVRALYLGANSHAKAGNRAQALEWTQRAYSVEPDDPGVLYNIACNYALLNEPEKAIDCLQKALALGFGHVQWIVNDSDLESLRTHPGFRAMLERLTKPPE